MPPSGLLESTLLPDNSTKLSAVVVGARTQRQGTGPFIAAGLAAAGVAVSGIVGTSPESVALARQELTAAGMVPPQSFTDLDSAMDQLQPNTIAICSPWRVHAQQLSQVAAAGRHCLVEKPLAWPASEAQADEIITAFEQQSLLLQVVNQWPTTLPAFARLHGHMPTSIDRFTMRLSPISIGPDMVTDSAPHFIGMLQALAGPGECENCKVASGETHDGEQQLQLDCDYLHGAGVMQATLMLETQQERPRPAWYQINELRADRQVEFPEYQQYLACGERREPLADPIHQVADDFARQLRAGATTQGDILRAAHRNLLQLAAALS